MRKTIACSFLFSLFLSSTFARDATAEIPQIVREGTNPYFATFTMGPAIEVAGDWGTQFKLSQELGYHFSGSFSGPAFGLSIDEAFGNCTDAFGVSCFSFSMGPKF